MKPSKSRANERLTVLASQLRTVAAHASTAASPAVIAGAVVVDILACPSTDADVRRGSSVPGRVRHVPGGVGRNIADGVSQLLQPSSGGPAAPASAPPPPPPLLVSLIGDDAAGTLVMSTLKALRLDLSCLQVVPGAPTPSVSAVLDRSGEVAACIADVAAVEQHLTPARLRALTPRIAAAPLLVVEANMTAKALAAACGAAAGAGVPVLLEPVSVPKSVRAASVLPHLTYITPNAAELIAIADEVARQQGRQPLPRPAEAGQGEGGSGSGDGAVKAALAQLAPFAAVVLGRGTKFVVLTLGAQGAALLSLAGDRQQQAASGSRVRIHVAHMRALPAEVVSLSGAGDTLVAGMVSALLMQHGPEEALAYGMAAARRTVQSPHNVPSDLGPLEALAADAGATLSSLTRSELTVHAA